MDSSSSSRRSRVPEILLAAYLVFFTVCAIRPYDREVWFAENLPIVLIVAALAATAPRFRFSNSAYVMMAVLVFLHTIGGHFTFERVPFGWVSELFGFERNHYDRMAHFSVGFYAFAAAEILDRRQLVTAKWMLFVVPVMAIFTVASVYEIIEWLFAVSSDPSAGASFLGSQGDIWDAQKDMLADGLGAVFAAALYLVIRRPGGLEVTRDQGRS